MTNQPVKYLFSKNEANPPAGLTYEEQHTWRARMVGAACGYIDEDTWLRLAERANEGTRKDREIRATVAAEIEKSATADIPHKGDC